MNKFLTLKHWQLFGVLIGIPFLFQMISFTLVIASHRPGVMFFVLPVLFAVYMGLFFAWFYSLGTNLYRKLPATAKMNLTRFKVFLLIPVIYMTLLCVGLFGAYSSALKGVQPNPLIFIFIFPVHFFCMFCIFYCLYFNAKALKAAEWQRPVTFSDFAGEFFMIWFFPVGIWILQPRINKLFENKSGTPNDSLPGY